MSTWSPPGARIQRPPEESLPQRHHALGHAAAGRLQLPLAGSRPAREERARVQVEISCLGFSRVDWVRCVGWLGISISYLNCLNRKQCASRSFLKIFVQTKRQSNTSLQCKSKYRVTVQAEYICDTYSRVVAKTAPNETKTASRLGSIDTKTRQRLFLIYYIVHIKGKEQNRKIKTYLKFKLASELRMSKLLTGGPQ